MIPETKASDEKKGKTTVYVKSIALTTVKNREKGTKQTKNTPKSEIHL